MKKILAVILGILILAGGLLGCKPKEPEPDQHEGLYGIYHLVSFESGGIEVRDGENLVELESLPSAKVSTQFPKYANKINNFIIELIGKIGDTVTITKDKIKFSKGNIIIDELDYNISGSSYINIHKEDFPIGMFRFDTLGTPPIYQLEISKGMYFSPEPDNGPWRPDYEVYFFYLK